MPHANRILIVDDDLDIRHLFAAALRDENYLIESRFDGLQALLFLETQPFDLVITDVRMPGLNGLEWHCHVDRFLGGMACWMNV